MAIEWTLPQADSMDYTPEEMLLLSEYEVGVRAQLDVYYEQLAKDLGITL